MSLRLQLAGGALGALLLASSARGAVSGEARFFDDLARRAYAAGRFTEALEAFMHVNAVAPSPASLYNIAITADGAKRTDVAFVHYRQYLAGGDSDSARRADAEARLEKLKRGLALVLVETDPPGASVFVDREELGAYGTTPTMIVAEPGTRTILLRASGREGVSLQVTAARGSTAVASAKLEARLGLVKVRTSPGEARLVFLRAEQVVAPLQVEGQTRLPVGSYTVQVSAGGHAKRELAVTVSETQPVDVSVELEALPPEQGTLLVGCDVAGAEVWVDGTRAAQTPATLQVALGRHQVEVRAKGKRFVRTVVVGKAAASYVEAALNRGSK